MRNSWSRAWCYFDEHPGAHFERRRVVEFLDRMVGGIAYWIVRRVKARREPAAQVLGAEVETDSQRIPAGRS